MEMRLLAEFLCRKLQVDGSFGRDMDVEPSNSVDNKGSYGMELSYPLPCFNLGATNEPRSGRISMPRAPSAISRGFKAGRTRGRNIDRCE